jgi:hypothetical protein
MNTGTQLLSGQRLTRVIQSLQDVRELPASLQFLARTRLVNATDDEITVRMIGRVQIADLVADDEVAGVYNWLRFSEESVNIPNLKVGLKLKQSDINKLNALRAGTFSANGNGASMIENLYGRWGDTLLLGVRQRQEALCVAMYTDAYSYDRLGVKITGATWGMPSDLKVTLAIPWTDAVNGLPVTDILGLQQVARQRYGIAFNRMDMSTAAFNYMIGTAQFINRVRLFYSVNATIDASVLGLQDVQSMTKLAAPILGLKEINLYDSRYWTQDAAGALQSVRYLPANQVVFSDSGNDGDARVMDLANAVVAESQVASIVPTSMIGELPEGEYGPISYATPTSPDLNPPGITAWGVGRNWPRKWVQQSTAVLTVGQFGDTLAPGVPFPTT